MTQSHVLEVSTLEKYVSKFDSNCEEKKKSMEICLKLRGKIRIWSTLTELHADGEIYSNSNSAKGI